MLDVEDAFTVTVVHLVGVAHVQTIKKVYVFVEFVPAKTDIPLQISDIDVDV